ncbi:MAG: transporter [SAR324 cluster bacterium]|nr:transporter [SAR324 cluster bacterium]
MVLLKQPVFVLLIVVILGLAIGKLKYKSFELGSSAVIFVALLSGYLGYTIPSVFQTLGLVFFIYSIGLQAGPGFISSFRSEGLTLTLGALFLVVAGMLTTIGVCLFFGYGSGVGAGLFAGAMTSTPGLAVAVDLTTGKNAAAAYGVTYSFGVIGVILFVKLLPQILKIDIPHEEQQIQEEISAQHPPVTYHHIVVNNPNIFNKMVMEIKLDHIAPVSITRLQRSGENIAHLVSGNTVLQEGDRLRIVGTEEDLQKVEMMVGRRTDEDIHFDGDMVVRQILVSKRRVIGNTISSLNFGSTFNVRVSRLTRSGFDLPASASIRLRMGDVLHLVGNSQSIDNIARLLGNDVKSVYGTDVFTVLLGMMIGFVVSIVPVYLPGVGELTLGITGGVLFAGLILGYLYSTGPLVWDIPVTGNNFIRELGLVLFLASVGTNAGSSIVQTIQEQGMGLFVSGIAVTLIPMILGFPFCYYFLKIRFLRTLGVLTGGMTSTPGLASTTSLSDTPHAASAYATVYPVALIGMIVCTRFLVWLLNIINP